jgi:GTP-binding protein
VADLLRRARKPVFLAVNKVDNHKRLMDANEFWSLGFENVFFIASISGSGTGELLDAVAEQVSDEPEIQSDLPKIAIIGQPNVGKSSLTNALLGMERNIVTDIAGTTRDPTHSHYNKFGKEFLLIDTAGIRKKAKVHEDLEFYSVMRAIQALDECDVMMLMIDAQSGTMEAQDMTIFRLAMDRHKGVVLLVNKWDLVEKDTNTARDFEAKLKEKLSPFSDVPVIFISALEKQRIFKAVDVALEVYERRKTTIKTSVLNDFLEEAVAKYPAPAYRGNLLKVKYATQLSNLHYPSFVFFCNHPKHLGENYKRYLENELRKKFDFSGVPISLFFREK